MKPMRILVACEESQEVCKAFRARGHEAYSCDLLSCSGGHPEWHLMGDVRKVIFQKWDLLIAHPPCTFLCNSGVRWLKGNPERFEEMIKGAEFFSMLLKGYTGHIERVAAENPIPHKHALKYMGRKYDQILQPWQFGHGEVKATCLWLRGLPKLQPTNIVIGREPRVWKMGPSPERAKMRSKTFPGIALAMAQQWSPNLNPLPPCP